MGFLIALYQVSFLEGWGLVGAFFFFSHPKGKA